ncbi:hypothetical protein HYW59_03240 [Candidatus Kaiserbacteria bacterium]|nr:hypothetical protein [Candidatus Kaiserbacteria bacterium]
MNTYGKRTSYPIRKIAVRSSVQDKKHPLREVIEKCIGTHDLRVVVEEDFSTISAMKRDDVVAFICSIVREGKVLSQGRGSVILPSSGRFLTRSVHSAFNSSIADAAIRATKVLDTFRCGNETNTVSPIGEAYRAKEDEESAPATDRQKSYLRELIQINLDEDEREKWESQLGELTKQEASRMIASFQR